ncbi:phage major tail tube protein [Breoghania sp.]|uniref:phage major tail tube protein n=1 Tax=Breoghania sp. TaxID=2065378 RepID=UPI002AA656B4|nr:phage major tail tube protein [Breoghania sp.]
MAAFPRVLRNMNLYVDGVSYAGKCASITLPPLSLVLEAIRNGGMDAPIGHDMGMEQMDFSAVMDSFEPELLALFGIENTPIVARGAVKAQGGEVEPVVVTMRGKFVSLEHGEWAPGSKAQNTFTGNLSYLKYEQNDIQFAEIDILNMIRSFNGVDQLEAQRAALGL